MIVITIDDTRSPIDGRYGGEIYELLEHIGSEVLSLSKNASLDVLNGKEFKTTFSDATAKIEAK